MVVVHFLTGILVTAGGTLHGKILVPFAVAEIGSSADLVPNAAVLAPGGFAVTIVIATDTATKEGR